MAWIAAGVAIGGALLSKHNQPKAPATPDYKGAAEATGASNLAMLNAQTQANRPNQNTPFGSTTWAKDAQGGWTQNTTLTPESQAALEDQQKITAGRSDLAGGLLDRAKGEFSDTMDWDQFGKAQGIQGDPNAVRDKAESSLYGKATSRLDPRFSQKREQQEAALRNQGLRPGDEAYDMQMANLGREETDAYGQASMDASMFGGQEGQLNQNMGAQSAGFNNTVRQNNIAEQMQKRGFSLNEINAILTGQQVGLPEAPAFTNAGKAPGVDYTGVAKDQYGANMDQFSIGNAQNDAFYGGLSSAFQFSDHRLKKNIQFQSIHKGRFWYTWDWIWGGQGQGVIAQENLDIATMHPSGYLMVDYGRI